MQQHMDTYAPPASAYRRNAYRVLARSRSKRTHTDAAHGRRRRPRPNTRRTRLKARGDAACSPARMHALCAMRYASRRTQQVRRYLRVAPACARSARSARGGRSCVYAVRKTQCAVRSVRCATHESVNMSYACAPAFLKATL
jgi:hypothetical protein